MMIQGAFTFEVVFTKYIRTLHQYAYHVKCFQDDLQDSLGCWILFVCVEFFTCM